MLSQVIEYARSQRERYIQDLMEYLAIPSVSAQPEHALSLIHI